ncbi:nuclear speckle RNA-binding protein B-like [Syzygium oleosum]|uniref:nuclear speckle RNA-binding protein B-like n=1 Tax=Syzygium oleosum TaxID=219896 RepID=UPI0011D26525|nr:nuclear speckle RNA-binding protein B-like [Syzygium oleosum]
MADPYYAYAAPAADRATVARASFPGYLSSETPSLASHHAFGYEDLRAFPSDALQKDVNPVRPGTYGIDDILGSGIRPEPGTGRLAAGTSLKGYSTPLEDPVLHQRQDFSAGERSSSLRNVDSLTAPTRESNILFVHGLPTDCTRREVGHMFRPFYGFKDIRVIHKEARRSGDRALVLCFVEFVDSKCAFTAMEALQGYQFDDKKPDSPVLRIQFAHFPLRLPSEKMM